MTRQSTKKASQQQKDTGKEDQEPSAARPAVAPPSSGTKTTPQPVTPATTASGKGTKLPSPRPVTPSVGTPPAIVPGSTNVTATSVSNPGGDDVEDEFDDDDSTTVVSVPSYAQVVPQVHNITPVAVLPFPILNHLSESEWKSFKIKYKTYGSRGGSVPITACLSEDAQYELMSFFPDEFPEDSEIYDFLNTMFDDKDWRQQLFQLQKLQRSGPLSRDSVIQYMGQYNRILASAEGNQIPKRKVYKTFINNLNDAYLSSLLEDISYRDLADLYKQTLAETTFIVRSREVPKSQHGTRPQQQHGTRPPPQHGTRPTHPAAPAAAPAAVPVAAPVPGYKPSGTTSSGTTGYKPSSTSSTPGYKPSTPGATPGFKPSAGTGTSSGTPSAGAKGFKQQTTPVNTIVAESVVPVFNGMVNDKKATILLDTGAAICLIKAAFTEGLTLNSLAKPLTLSTVAGTLTVSNSVDVHVRVDDTEDTIRAVVIGDDNSCPYDCIIGYKELNGSPFQTLLFSKEELPLDVSELLTVHPIHIGDTIAQQPLEALVAEFADVFEEPSGFTPAAVPPLVLQVIPGAEPVAHKPRRMSTVQQAEIQRQVRDLLANGFIRRSTSPYASIPHLVGKPDDTWRLVVNYKKINDILIPMASPMKLIDDIINSLGSATIFGHFDLRQGFFQFPLSPESCQFTAFITADGLWEFTVIPFGVSVAPNYFQSIMNDVLAGIDGVQVYVDDIIIYHENIPGFIAVTRQVLQRLRDYNLKLKGAKCHLGVTELQYLGFHISAKGITLTDERKEAILIYPFPQDTTGLQRFNGFVNYFRKFIPHFSELMAPLTTLASASVPFQWNADIQEAFDQVRQAIANVTTLSLPKYDRLLFFSIETDASDIALGGVLKQHLISESDDPDVEIVAFISYKFKPVEQRWSVIEKECYAVVYTLSKLRSYVLGHRVVIYTDHKNLLWMVSSTADKVIRWLLRLQEFAPEIHYIKGVDNVAADAISRMFSANCIQMLAEEVYTIQTLDTSTNQVNAYIHLVHNWFVGHHGIRKTVQLLRKQGHKWARMEDDVRTYIKSCPACQKFDRSVDGPETGSLRTTTVNKVFQTWILDTVGPLPKEDNHSYVLVAIDGFSRFVELFPIAATDAKSVVRPLLSLVGRYGVPATIKSDNGPQFNNAVIHELVNSLSSPPHTCIQTFSIPNRPQSNGLVERSIQTMLTQLRKIVFDLTNEKKFSWTQALPFTMRILNTSKHGTTGFTPAEMLWGSLAPTAAPDLPLVDDSKDDTTVTVDTPTLVQELCNVQDAVWKIAQKHQQTVLDKRGVSDAPDKPTTYTVNQWILVKVEDPPKLEAPWDGPFQITSIQHDRITYTNQHGHPTVVHVSKVKPFDTTQVATPTNLQGSTRQYVIQEIVSHKGSLRAKTKLRFVVKWAGYPQTEEPYDVVKTSVALKDYVQRKGLKLKLPISE